MDADLKGSLWSSDIRFKTVHRNHVTSGQLLNTGQLTDEPLLSTPSLILSALPQECHKKMPDSNSVKSHRAAFKAMLIMHKGVICGPRVSRSSFMVIISFVQENIS